MNEQLLLILVCAISAVGLWWLYFIEYRNYCNDRTRQRLFDIRDHLFQQAKEGAIPFDSDAYGITRRTLNGMIRFTHNLSLTRVLISMVTHKSSMDREYVTKYEKQMHDALNKLPLHEKKVILKTIFNMHMAVMNHIIRNSIVLVIIFEVLRNTLRWIHMWQKVRNYLIGKKSRAKWSVVDAEANGISQSA